MGSCTDASSSLQHHTDDTVDTESEVVPYGNTSLELLFFSNLEQYQLHGNTTRKVRE